MSRGKQAAAAANRRADAAQEEARVLKERLKAERAEWDAREKQFKAEIGQLKESLVDKAAQLASEELVRLNERVIELTAQVSDADERIHHAAKARDYLMRSMAKYLSMSQGTQPTDAAAAVITWLTNEPFDQKTDTDKIAAQLDIPQDGWILTELRKAQTAMRVDSVQGYNAVPLEEAEKRPVEFNVHPSYQSHWYEKVRAPRLDRKQKGLGQKVYTKLIVRQRPVLEDEKETS